MRFDKRLPTLFYAVAAVVVLAVANPASAGQAQAPITSPEEFFGFELGSDRKIARWDAVVEYFGLLEKQSGRIQVTDMGPSTEGHPFLLVIISSADNMANLERLRQQVPK